MNFSTAANITITVLNPQPVRCGDEDEDSIVLRLAWGETSFFLTGDAGTGAEGRILASGIPLDHTYFTFLKVGDHGSETAPPSPSTTASTSLRRTSAPPGPGSGAACTRRTPTSMVKSIPSP